MKTPETNKKTTIVVTKSKGKPHIKPKTISNFASVVNSEKEGRKVLSEKINNVLSRKDQKGNLTDIADPPFDLMSLGQLMIKNTWNHACIAAKTSTLIGSGWKLLPSKEHIDELKELEERKEELEEIENPSVEEKKELLKVLSTLESYQRTTEKLKKLFKKPNQRMTTVEVAENSFTDREGIGQGFWEVSVNAITAYPDHFSHVPSVTMYKLKNRDGWVKIAGSERTFYKDWGDWGIYDKTTGEKHGYFVTDEEGNVARKGASNLATIIWENDNGEKQTELSLDKWANAVITFYKYNPMDPYYGLPDGIPALQAMAGKEAADEFNYAEFDNYGMARWAVVVEGSVLDQNAEKTIETFFEEDMNEHAHGVLIIRLPPIPASPLPGAPAPEQPKITFQRLDTEQHEGHFQEYRHDLRDEVLASHNVPPHLVSIIESGNLGGGQGNVQMQNFVKNVIMPLKTKVEYQINRIITEGYQVDWLYFTFDTSDLTGELDLAKISQIYSNVYAITINEIRERAGLDPVNGGDRIFIVIPGIGLLFVDDLDELDSMLIPGGQIPSEAPIGEPKEPEEPPSEPGEEDEGEGKKLMRVLGELIRSTGKKEKGITLNTPVVLKKRKSS